MGSIYEQFIDLLRNGANSPNLLITNRLQIFIGPQLETDQVSQSLFEKSSLDDMTQSAQKKKIKETIQKDLEDIGIWNNIETIENNLTKMKTRMKKQQHWNSRLTCVRKLYRCLLKINIYFNLVKRGSNLTFNTWKKIYWN